MTARKIDAYLKEKTHVESDFKVEWDAFRFMLDKKMFAMRAHNKEGIPILTLKLPPQEGASYRELYAQITPGYYMNKVHWISIPYETASWELLCELMDKAYACGVHALPKKIKQQWGCDSE